VLAQNVPLQFWIEGHFLQVPTLGQIFSPFVKKTESKFLKFSPQKSQKAKKAPILSLWPVRLSL
jgi:hypothetical protein